MKSFQVLHSPWSNAAACSNDIIPSPFQLTFFNHEKYSLYAFKKVRSAIFFVCVCIMDVHLHHWHQCNMHLSALPTIWYIKHRTTNVIRYDSTLLWCVRHDFIQHSATELHTMWFEAMQNNDAMQFSMDRQWILFLKLQQIINKLKKCHFYLQICFFSFLTSKKHLDLFTNKPFQVLCSAVLSVSSSTVQYTSVTLHTSNSLQFKDAQD